MSMEQIISQLRSLIEDAESHRNSDGTLDEVFQNDIEALTAAINAFEGSDMMKLVFISVGMIAAMFIMAAVLACVIVSDDRKD